MKIVENIEQYQPLAELMAREGLTHEEAATRLGLTLTTQQLRNLARTKGFKRLLLSEENRYFREVGTNPDWDRKTAIGKLLICAEKLFLSGKFAEAAEVILKASKVEGWLGETGNVTVIAGMTGKELADVRAKLQAKLDAKAAN